MTADPPTYYHCKLVALDGAFTVAEMVVCPKFGRSHSVEQVLLSNGLRAVSGQYTMDNISFRTEFVVIIDSLPAWVVVEYPHWDDADLKVWSIKTPVPEKGAQPLGATENEGPP